MPVHGPKHTPKRHGGKVKTPKKTTTSKKIRHGGSVKSPKNSPSRGR